jgi:hypothetical protein
MTDRSMTYLDVKGEGTVKNTDNFGSFGLDVLRVTPPATPDLKVMATADRTSSRAAREVRLANRSGVGTDVGFISSTIAAMMWRGVRSFDRPRQSC